MRMRAYGYFAVMALMLGLPAAAEACATCFGASDSDMAQGMNAGIVSLLVVLAFVLSSVTAFFVFLGVRCARRSDGAESSAET
jgi:hypothetical protein